MRVLVIGIDRPLVPGDFVQLEPGRCLRILKPLTRAAVGELAERAAADSGTLEVSAYQHSEAGVRSLAVGPDVLNQRRYFYQAQVAAPLEPREFTKFLGKVIRAAYLVPNSRTTNRLALLFGDGSIGRLTPNRILLRMPAAGSPADQTGVHLELVKGTVARRARIEHRGRRVWPRLEGQTITGLVGPFASGAFIIEVGAALGILVTDRGVRLIRRRRPPALN